MAGAGCMSAAGASCLTVASGCDCETLCGCGTVDCVDTEAIELSKPLDEVGVIGLVAWLEVEVGEARSF